MFTLFLIGFAILLVLAVASSLLFNGWWKLISVFLVLAIVYAAWFWAQPFLLTPVYVETTTSKPVTTSNDPNLNCVEANVVASQTHGGKVEVDLNDGDPFDYSLTVVTPNTPSNTKTLVVLAEPGYIFDVVHPVMYFTSYRLQGNLDQVLCSTSILVEKKAFAYVFVGEAKTPEGWTTTDIKGWWTELVAKQYSDEKTVTPGGEWNTFQIAGSDKDRDLVSKNLIYGQFWNPNYGGTVVHIQIQKGYTLKAVPDWQGTYWAVVGADPKLVQDRFIQASKEVVERDALSLKNVTLLFCGDPAKMPTTKLKVGSDTIKWESNLKYWVCEKTPQ